MFRKSAVVAAMLLLSVVQQAFALGLGEIDMRSALNQPMEAVIELTSSAGTKLEDIEVSLATLEEHSRAGLSRAAILSNFNLVVERNRAGNAIIRISSDELVREPYLEFLLELDWPRGRLLRQYTVLVDPPVTIPATPAIPATPVSRPATPAPVARAPAPRPVQRPVTAPATVSVAPRPAAADEYGPIRRSETLWNIAEQVRPGSDISMQQMMLALQRANPGAFVDNNINRLKAGVTLDVPGRDEILSVSAREARAETSRQYEQWKTNRSQPAVAAVTQQPDAMPEQEADVSPADTGSRLQLTAPESDAVSGAALPGDPASSDTAAGNQELQQQLALATEEVAAGRAQSEELQSRVGELEEQITTMKRLLELKDNEFASLQQSITSSEEQQTAAPVADDAKVPAGVTAETPDDVMPAEEDTAELGLSDQAAGLVNRLLDNPLLAGLGVLVAMLLGGFLWASTRSRAESSFLDDSMTMQGQLAETGGRETDFPVQDVSVRETEMPAADASPVMDDDVDGDPVTEADVYLAYGRIQQAEDVLLAALQAKPDNADARLKLLEVYNTGGNTAAFDHSAAAFHEMFGETDERWQKIATMGLAMSPHNALYGGSAPAAEEGAEFDMDLSGLEDVKPQPDAAAEPVDTNTIEFTLDTLDSDEEDLGEGLLDTDDEVTTKLDLARAYIDMDDKDSARSILDEVLEQGNTDQKEEAESIISQLA